MAGNCWYPAKIAHFSLMATRHSFAFPDWGCLSVLAQDYDDGVILVLWKQSFDHVDSMKTTGEVSYVRGKNHFSGEPCPFGDPQSEQTWRNKFPGHDASGSSGQDYPHEPNSSLSRSATWVRCQASLKHPICGVHVSLNHNYLIRSCSKSLSTLTICE